jgi:hypothetical protein
MVAMGPQPTYVGEYFSLRRRYGKPSSVSKEDLNILNLAELMDTITFLRNSAGSIAASDDELPLYQGSRAIIKRSAEQGYWFTA